MWFVFQKIVWFLVLPPASVLIAMIAGLALLERRRNLGRALLAGGMAVLYLLSLGPTADLILRPLERRYPPVRAEAIKGRVDAVVVPGGGSIDLAWMGADPVPNAETLSRIVTGVELARRLKAPLVLCGGNGEPFSTKVNDADAMARAAIALGMPRARLIVEDRSRNTLENAHAVRALLTGDRIVLATSAYYLRRATAFFSRRGFTVIPAPTYFLSQTRVWTLAALIPRAGDFNRSCTGIAEWISMLWWTMRGEL